MAMRRACLNPACADPEADRHRRVHRLRPRRRRVGLRSHPAGPEDPASTAPRCWPGRSPTPSPPSGWRVGVRRPASTPSPSSATMRSSAFVDEVGPLVADGRLVTDPGLGVTEDDLAPLRSHDPRPPELLADGTIVRLDGGRCPRPRRPPVLGGLDGRAWSSRERVPMVKEAISAVTEAGATVVEADGSTDDASPTSCSSGAGRDRSTTSAADTVTARGRGADRPGAGDGQGVRRPVPRRVGLRPRLREPGRAAARRLRSGWRRRRSSGCAT